MKTPGSPEWEEWAAEKKEGILGFNGGEFQQRHFEAVEAADGDLDFLTDEILRIQAEAGIEGVLDKEDMLEFAEKSRDEQLVEIVFLQSQRITALSDAIFGMAKEAAKSPKHLSAHCRKLLDPFPKEERRS